MYNIYIYIQGEWILDINIIYIYIYNTYGQQIDRGEA